MEGRLYPAAETPHVMGGEEEREGRGGGEGDSSLEYHLSYLVGIDYTPVLHTEDLTDLTRANCQRMICQLCSLPTEVKDDGVYVSLPPPVKNSSFKMPRMHPLPETRAKTRWEAFAKEKGIMKKKRSRLVWDEATKDWVPRWGYRGKQEKENAALAVIEAKGGEYLGRKGKDRGVMKKSRSKKEQAPSSSSPSGETGTGSGDGPESKKRKRGKDDQVECPFLEREREKKLVKAKQKFRELRNKLEATQGGKRLPPGVLAQLATTSIGRGGEQEGLYGGGKRKKIAHRGQTKDELKEVLRRAQTSTASFGEYDKLGRGEKKQRQRTRTKGVCLSADEEKKKYMRQLKEVLHQQQQAS
ncbi:ribosome biogenesis regulatory protein [Cystoisospora suis]|uniref:Ribosome biogenesis regulatory protein n=1 Tax=Cystoisospora suis TaxID=483139 RepID=A0A2C6L7Z2_9APIC|nr:ribosome biogenesis regulatory protein [Cystoisospora suis]